MIWVLAYFIVGFIVAVLSIPHIVDGLDDSPGLVGLFFVEFILVWPLIVVFFVIIYLGAAIIRVTQPKDDHG